MKLLLSVLFSLGLILATAGTLRAERYEIDPAHSVVSFSVHQFLGTTRGTFQQCSGTVEIDRLHPERSSVSARIRVQSIDTGIRKRDSHLLSGEFFDAARYPEITFKSRSVKQTGPFAGLIQGDLTMHGVTRLITLQVKLLSVPKDGPLEARTRWAVTTEPVRRRDFNLAFSGAAEAFSGISPEVKIHLEIEANKALP